MREKGNNQDIQYIMSTECTTFGTKCTTYIVHRLHSVLHQLKSVDYRKL